MQLEKNIATVIVTDIVGYSKLTGDNQELALELLAEIYIFRPGVVRIVDEELDRRGLNDK